MSRDEIVAAARGWIGTPYRHQASLKGVGCDCLGLLRGVWREVIGREPEQPPPYAKTSNGPSGEEPLLDACLRHLAPGAGEAWRPGDVLLFRWRDGLPVRHCGIATTSLAMVHAHDAAAVAEVAVAPWWDRHLVGIFSFPGASA